MGQQSPSAQSGTYPSLQPKKKIFLFEKLFTEVSFLDNLLFLLIYRKAKIKKINIKKFQTITSKGEFFSPKRNDFLGIYLYYWD